MRHDLQHPHAADLFDGVQVPAVPVPVEDTAESYLALVATTSTYLCLNTDRRAVLDRSVRKLFAAAEGRDRWVDHAVLVTARRAGVLG